jgi:hypothetical protein
VRAGPALQQLIPNYVPAPLAVRCELVAIPRSTSTTTTNPDNTESIRRERCDHSPSDQKPRYELLAPTTSTSSTDLHGRMSARAEGRLERGGRPNRWDLIVVASANGALQVREPVPLEPNCATDGPRGEWIAA